MTYQYLCPQCNKEHTITKPMLDSNRVEHCECGEVLRRVYEAPVIGTNDGMKY